MSSRSLKVPSHSTIFFWLRLQFILRQSTGFVFHCHKASAYIQSHATDFFLFFLLFNKKVLPERKRHTNRRLSSTPCAVLGTIPPCWDTPRHLTWPGGTPPGWGTPRDLTWLGRAFQVPPPGWTWLGYPPPGPGRVPPPPLRVWIDKQSETITSRLVLRTRSVKITIAMTSCGWSGLYWVFVRKYQAYSNNFFANINREILDSPLYWYVCNAMTLQLIKFSKRNIVVTELCLHQSTRTFYRRPVEGPGFPREAGANLKGSCSKLTNFPKICTEIKKMDWEKGACAWWPLGSANNRTTVGQIICHYDFAKTFNCNYLRKTMSS